MMLGLFLMIQIHMNDERFLFETLVNNVMMYVNTGISGVLIIIRAFSFSIFHLWHKIHEYIGFNVSPTVLCPLFFWNFACQSVVVIFVAHRVSVSSLQSNFLQGVLPL